MTALWVAARRLSYGYGMRFALHVGKALPDWEGDTTDLVSQRAKLYAFERFDDGGTRY